jgi:hypothetical protein
MIKMINAKIIPYCRAYVNMTIPIPARQRPNAKIKDLTPKRKSGYAKRIKKQRQTRITGLPLNV